MVAFQLVVLSSSGSRRGALLREEYIGALLLPLLLERRFMLRRKEIIPNWIKPRLLPWEFAGWIPCKPVLGLNFNELIRDSLRSNHGETREVDYYSEGAALWWKE